MAPDASRDASTVTIDDLIERARAIGPTLADRRAKTHDLRRIPDETIADLV
ncbi:MAG: acyl-CoA dehydrogenase, partial [Rhodospirillaceae bacterium]|nr:acyl-CoA dehydrogenase [Rhodospirillaceae bacterium]